MALISKLFNLSAVIRTVTVVGVIAFSIWYRSRRSRTPRIVVCSIDTEWERVADDFRKSLSDGLLGLDCEWVSVRSKSHRVALLQMAGNSELCVIIRLCQMEAPPEIRDILENPLIIKFGVGIIDDAKRLENDYGIKVNGCLDLRYMALATGYMDGSTKGLSLGALSAHFAKYELDKTSRVRWSNWEASRLSARQLVYAARDAFAGIKVARSLLRRSLLQSLHSQCYSTFALYIDKPFRMSPTKQKTAKNESKPRAKRSKGMPVTRSDQKLYKNAVMKAPDGEILCNTDVVKIDWYLKMDLATLESQDPLVIRLKFEPQARAVLGGDFYVGEKPNICVVCGTDKMLLKKNVVPLEYRKLFPPLMKSHTSHDSVLVCVRCQNKSIRQDVVLRETLDAECPNEVSAPMVQSLKRAACALKRAGEKLPESKRTEFVKLLEDHFQAPISDTVIEEASKLDEQQWMRDNGLTHAQRVVAKYSAGEGLFALEMRFRQHFLDTMEPEHLSPKWSITHNHDAVLMKVATGRFTGPQTLDEFLRILGASWLRLGEVVTAILDTGIVDENKIVIWDELKEAGIEVLRNKTTNAAKS